VRVISFISRSLSPESDCHFYLSFNCSTRLDILFAKHILRLSQLWLTSMSAQDEPSPMDYGIPIFEQSLLFRSRLPNL